MPLSSVEALLDDRLAGVVVGEWERLRAAGLPSQADHGGASNAPHLTLWAGPGIPDHVADRLATDLAATAPPPLPVPVTLGPLVLLGTGRPALARIVLPTAALLALHRLVAAVLVDGPAPAPTTSPARWLPHVTLARRLPGDRLPAALTALGEVAALEGALTAVRRWDPATRSVTLLHAASEGDAGVRA